MFGASTTLHRAQDVVTTSDILISTFLQQQIDHEPLQHPQGHSTRSHRDLLFLHFNSLTNNCLLSPNASTHDAKTRQTGRPHRGVNTKPLNATLESLNHLVSANSSAAASNFNFTTNQPSNLEFRTSFSTSCCGRTCRSIDTKFESQLLEGV